MQPHLRIARPVRDLERSASMYERGVGLQRLGGFADHAGFDGVMLGWPGAGWHFELTACRHHPVAPSPSVEDLVVLYLPDRAEWEAKCQRVLAAGFTEVEAFNPYWQDEGRTFADPDGYRLVLQCASWS